MMGSKPKSMHDEMKFKIKTDATDDDGNYEWCNFILLV